MPNIENLSKVIEFAETLKEFNKDDDGWYRFHKIVWWALGDSEPPAGSDKIAYVIRQLDIDGDVYARIFLHPRYVFVREDCILPEFIRRLRELL